MSWPEAFAMVGTFASLAVMLVFMAKYSWPPWQWLHCACLQGCWCRTW